ncbi:hypothetical protein FACS1894187_25870 [Synergistales bacterium]|nr:hypothetical protein FACS1894187_25870 [Synergistales bacterium]
MSEMLTISKRGQITVPAAVRAKYGLKARDKLFWEEVEDVLYILVKPEIFYETAVFDDIMRAITEKHNRRD